MVTIEDNTITMTRGDTLKTEVSVIVDDEEYAPADGDVITFAVKHSAMNTLKTAYTDAAPLILKTIPNGSLLLELMPEDTKGLGFGSYDYECEIVFADGTTDTFISDRLILTKEVN